MYKMDQNIRPQLEETPTANDDALHNMCINTVEFAETTFKNLQEKIRTDQVVLSLVIENFNSRNAKLQGKTSEYNSGFQKASDHDLSDGEDDATPSEGDHEASKRSVNDNSNGGRAIEDDVSEEDHAEHCLDINHDTDLYDDDGEDDVMENVHHYAGDTDLANDTEAEHVPSMNDSESNSFNLPSESEDNSEAEQYNRASYEENASTDDEDETMEGDTLEEEQDTSDDGEEESPQDGEEYDEAFPDDDTPETSAEQAKYLREFMNEHNQRKIIARQQDKILKLKLANLNLASQIDEAESLEYLSNTIAAGEAALEDQKQCLEELSKMVKQIIARMDILKTHISKPRSGPLPEKDVGHISNFCEKCQKDIKELLESYGVVLEHLSAEGDDQEEGVGEDEVSEDHQTAEEEDQEEDVGEDEGEHEGEYEEEHEGEDEADDQGEDEEGVEDQAMLAPVQPAALTFTLPFFGGKRSREIDGDGEEPSAKRGRFVEEEL